MKKLILLIGLIAVLALTPSVEAAARPVSEIFNVTYTGDQICGTSCTSYVFLEMLEKPKQQDYINWSIQVGLNNTKSAAERVGNIDEFATYFSEENMGYELKILQNQECNTHPAEYENGTLYNHTNCKDVYIDFTWENIASQFSRIGDVATIAILGNKEYSESVKWSMNIGDVYIDPLWQGYWGYSYLSDVGATTQAWTTNQYGGFVRFNAPANINVTDIAYQSGAASGNVPTYRVRLEYPDSSNNNKTPNGTYVGGSTIYCDKSGTDFDIREFVICTLPSNVTLYENNTYFIVSTYQCCEAPDVWNRTGIIYVNPTNGVMPALFANMTDINTAFGYTSNNMTTWNYYDDSYSPFLIKYNGEWWGNSVEPTFTNYNTRQSLVYAQTFTMDDNIQIENITWVSKLTSGESDCNTTANIIKGTEINSSWLNYVETSCYATINDYTLQKRTCTLDSPYSVTSGQNYTLIFYSPTCVYPGNNAQLAVGSQTKMDWYLSEWTYGGSQDYMIYSSNNFTSHTVRNYTDIPFGFGWSEIAPDGYLTTLLDTPSANTNFTKNEWNEFTINITCTGGSCGNAFAYLDPKEVEKRKKEEFLRHHYYAPGNYCSLGGLSR